MALGDVINSIIELTGRPDKETYIRASANSIIRMLASLKDQPITLVEIKPIVPITLLVHTLALPLDFRKVSYIRTAAFPEFLTEVDPLRAIQQNRQVINCFYRSGNNLIINLGKGRETTELAFGYYAHPALLTSDTQTNWILEDYQDLVIDLLASKVLRTTGDIATADAIERSASIRMQQLEVDSTLSTAVVG